MNYNKGQKPELQEEEMRRDCHVLSRTHLSNLSKKREREKIRDLQRNECKEELQVASVCFPCLVL